MGKSSKRFIEMQQELMMNQDEVNELHVTSKRFIEMQQELMMNQDEVNELHVIYETLTYQDCDNRA
jgi:hypothetical protein